MSNKKINKNKKEKQLMYCNGCDREHDVNSFYITYNPIYESRKDNCGNMRMPFCKNFIIKQCTNEDKSISLDKLKELLVQLDAPFLEDYWDAAKQEKGNTLRIYFKNLSLKQNRGLRWKDSVFNIKNNEQSNKKDEIVNKALTFDEKMKLKEAWGDEWSQEELILLDKTYKELSSDKNMKFNSSKQYMKLAVMNYVRSYMAMKSDKVSDAEKYTKLFNETMKMGEFNPSALAKNSNLEKLGSFCDFSLMVEECVDIIDIQKILPEYMQQPRDLPDKVIWYMINYMQDSLGMKRSSYEDIYKFYSQMEADFYGVPLGSIPKSSTTNDFLNIKEENEEENNAN